MCNQTERKIDVLIRARTPVLAIESPEEARVTAALRGIAKAQDKRLVTWSIARGFQQLVPGEQDPQPAADPTQAILRAADHEGDATIFVFKDMHPYLKRVPQALRALRDAVDSLINQRNTIILLSPSFEIPQDAQKDIHLVTFPLPTPNELQERVDDFIHNLPESVPVNLNGDKERLVRALQGLTDMEADSVLAQAAITHRALDKRAIAFVMEAKAQIIAESGALEYYPEKAGYNEIGGLDLLKAWARQEERAATPEARQFGIEASKGVLLVGVPGCGKSLTAKAIAGPNRPLLRLDVGALFGSLVGQSEAATRQALQVAEAVAPAVLWIDEIEKALGGASGGALDGGTSTRVLGTILTWMEEHQGEVFVVATANDIGSLRPELIRRFDEVFFVDLPQPRERAEILKIHLEKHGRSIAAFNLKDIVAATEGFAGSEIEKVVKAGLKRAFAQGHDLTDADLLAAASETVPLSTTMSEGINHMRQWAERARPASSAQETGHQAPGNGNRAGVLEFG